MTEPERTATAPRRPVKRPIGRPGDTDHRSDEEAFGIESFPESAKVSFFQRQAEIEKAEEVAEDKVHGIFVR